MSSVLFIIYVRLYFNFCYGTSPLVSRYDRTLYILTRKPVLIPIFDFTDISYRNISSILYTPEYVICTLKCATRMHRFPPIKFTSTSYYMIQLYRRTYSPLSHKVSPNCSRIVLFQILLQFLLVYVQLYNSNRSQRLDDGSTM